MQIPAPAPEAQAHSDRLKALIGTEIVRSEGWIPFARYMELALYAPGLGYYASGAAKFGPDGDFVTAPEISTLFGATLAVQVREVLAASRPVVLEFGAGTGRLAADLLRALGPACEQYLIIEPSPDLRERQQAYLRSVLPETWHKVAWREVPPSTFSGCVVANEVLDAMPVHLLERHAGGIAEIGVTLDEDKAFAFSARPAAGTLHEAAREALPPETADGYRSELNLAARGWVASMAGMLERGALLISDYGFPAAEYYHPQRERGTLMCHYRHLAHADPFLHPGLTDITAHVDFTATAQAGLDAGLDLLGYASQAGFLLDCGITALLGATPADNSGAYLPLANQVNRLVSPAEMGELVKVLALGRDIAGPLAGFASSDRSHRL
jgi:SAM-dependent MidA family methyltransferase